MTARILVADDDPITSRFLRSLFEGVGYDVLVAEDGEQAMQLAIDHGPDLIVSDVVMPYRDGFGLLRALQDDARVAHVPVVIVSMRDREEDIVRGLEGGAADYVVKPFNAKELLARVRIQLERGPGGH
jgi:DNA-binding response OmpR family regulator